MHPAYCCLDDSSETRWTSPSQKPTRITSCMFSRSILKFAAGRPAVSAARQPQIHLNILPQPAELTLTPSIDPTDPNRYRSTVPDPKLMNLRLWRRRCYRPAVFIFAGIQMLNYNRISLDWSEPTEAYTNGLCIMYFPSDISDSNSVVVAQWAHKRLVNVYITFTTFTIAFRIGSESPFIKRLVLLKTFS